VDRDRISRPATVLGIALGAVGATIVIALPWIALWAPALPEPVLTAFVFEPDFLAWRAPWVLLLWAGTLALTLVALSHGRWSGLTRKVGLAIAVGWLLLLTWWILTPVFVDENAEAAVKFGLVVVLVFVVVEIVIAIRRLGAGFREPVSASPAIREDAARER
jgi:hypothetical protein